MYDRKGHVQSTTHTKAITSSYHRFKVSTSLYQHFVCLLIRVRFLATFMIFLLGLPSPQCISNCRLVFKRPSPYSTATGRAVSADHHTSVLDDWNTYKLSEHSFFKSNQHSRTKMPSLYEQDLVDLYVQGVQLGVHHCLYVCTNIFVHAYQYHQLGPCYDPKKMLQCLI